MRINQSVTTTNMSLHKRTPKKNCYHDRASTLQITIDAMEELQSHVHPAAVALHGPDSSAQRRRMSLLQVDDAVVMAVASRRHRVR